jgi:hypothetical protein
MDSENEEYSDSVETILENNSEENDSEDEDNKFYTIESPEYKQYKKKLLGSEVSNDDSFSTYTLVEKTKDFIENIKSYGLNLPIVKSHYKKLAKQLLEEEKPTIINELIVVEYTKLKTKDIKSLCGLIDGHHRGNAIKECLKLNPKIKIKIRICVIQSDFPDSIETKKLFCKFNIIKPFSIDFISMEISDLIITKLNNEFNSKGFELIKDNTKVYRPSIQKNKINDAIQSRLEYLKKNKHINNNDINIDLICANFVKHNNYIKEQKIYENDKSITSAMKDKASKYECFLGLVNIDKIVNKCICEEYN